MYKPTGRTLVVDDIKLIEVICDKCRRTKFCSEDSGYVADRCVICEIKESAKKYDEEIKTSEELNKTPEFHVTTVEGLISILSSLENRITREVHILPREYGDVIQVTDPILDGKEVVLIYVGEFLSK